MANICEKCMHRNVCRYQEPCEECNQFAEEVVRCKDCKHYTPARKHPWSEETGYDFSKIEILRFGECCGQDFHFTEDGELSVHESDFCSNGERREGE